MPRASTKVANQMVKAMGIKRRLEAAAAVDDDPKRLGALLAKLRRADRPTPSRRLQRHWAHQTIDVGGQVLHLLASRRGPGGRVILYLHGGAYMFGPFATEWAACHRVATAVNSDFALLVYPKAPEHTAPETLAVTMEAYSLLEERYGASNITMMGTSAGGGLALAIMMQLRDAGRPQPAAGVLISPGVDMTLAEPVDNLAAGDVLVSPAHVRSAGRLYAGELGPEHPHVSPAYGEPAGLPRLQILVGTAEILYPSIATFVDRLRSASVDVEVVVGDGQQHTWPLAPMPDGRDALGKIIEFIGDGS